MACQQCRSKMRLGTQIVCFGICPEWPLPCRATSLCNSIRNINSNSNSNSNSNNNDNSICCKV